MDNQKTSKENEFDQAKIWSNHTICTHTIVIQFKFSEKHLPLDLQYIYNSLPVRESIALHYETSIRLNKELMEGDSSSVVEPGSVVSASWRGYRKGLAKEKRRYMKNQVSFHLVLENKLVHIMLFGNGTVTLTGIKKENQIYRAKHYFVDLMKTFGFHVDYEQSNHSVKLINIKYNLGFEVNLVNMDYLLNLSQDGFTVTYQPQTDSQATVYYTEPETKRNYKFTVFAYGCVIQNNPPPTENIENVFMRFTDNLKCNLNFIKKTTPPHPLK